MADIPLFPDESNMARFQDFVNIQKEISEHLLAQKHLYEQIGRINRDVEDRVIQRRKKEWERLNLIQAQNVKYNDLVAKRGTLQGAAADRLEGQITSTLQLIKYNRELIDLSKLASEVEMTMAKKQYEEGNKWFKFVGEETQKMLGLDLKQFEAVKATGDKMLLLGNNTEAMAYSVGAVVMMLTGAFKLFKDLDKAAWEFRKSMGMSRTESAVIRKDAQRIAIDYMHVGVTADGVYKSFKAIGTAVGGVHNVSIKLVEDVSIMSAQLGIAEETSTGFMRNLAVISKSSMESQSNMMYMAQAMSAAAGVNLGQVMGDVATKSNRTLTMMSRLPSMVLRTAIELRRMGTDMGKAADAGSHVLDFSQSINEEMEASVLLGRSINLQRVREFAYSRNLEGSTKEVLRLAKEHGFATKMDYFQMQAFAQATGFSVDQLLNMVQTSEQVEKIRRSGTAEQQKQLKIYEDMRKSNEAAAKALAKNTEAIFRAKANQERLTAISAKWNQLLAKAQEWLLPIIDNLLAMVLPAMDIARGLFAWSGALKVVSPLMGGIVSLFGKAIYYFQSVETYGTKMTNVFQKMWYSVGKVAWYIGEWSSQSKKAFMSLSWIAKIRSWFSPLSTLGKVFGTIGGWFAKIGGWLGKIFAPIGKLLGFVGKFTGFIGFFAKWVPIIGWVITAFQFVGNLFKQFSAIQFVKGDWIGNIWKGIKAIGGALYDTLIQPFVDAYHWIMSFFGGKSPSLLGMYIVKGIVSIGGSIFDALTAPFRKGMAWIADKIPGMGKVAEKLRGGVSGGSVEKRAQAAYIPAVTVTPEGTKIAKAKDKDKRAGEKEKDESVPMSEETGLKIVTLLEKILAKDTNVSMDGQLLSSHLARQTEFRGGYGVNKVA
jgi:hypothetical protein